MFKLSSAQDYKEIRKFVNDSYLALPFENVDYVVKKSVFMNLGLDILSEFDGSPE